MFDLIVCGFALLMFLIGLKKGFAKMIISLLGVIVTLVLTVLLAKPFADFLWKFMPFDAWFTVPIQGWLGDNGFSGIAPASEADLIAMLTAANMPGFFASTIGPFIFKLIPTGVLGLSAAEVIAPIISDMIVLVLSGLVLFILLRIGVAIIQKIAKVFTNLPVISFINRILGGALGVVKAYVIVLCVFAVMSVMMGLSFMAPVNAKLEESKISKWIYENNFIVNWLLGVLSPAEGEADDADDGEPSAIEDDKLETIEIEGQKYNLVFAM